MTALASAGIAAAETHYSLIRGLDLRAAAVEHGDEALPADGELRTKLSAMFDDLLVQLAGKPLARRVTLQHLSNGV
ncbi:hypothetical protein [Paraburkholderia mimosarum]|uniref:hypothetical protein n=1 Tax=Paraburkholderia mimosarum TaxID=312026 RepID=UPI000406E359|nr:hypothetical protein [Paraburkholderia mimosarum]